MRYYNKLYVGIISLVSILLLGILLQFIKSDNSTVPEQVTTYLTGELIEEYSGEVKTGGPFLTGIWLGGKSDNFSVNLIQVLIPTDINKPNVCFSATTRDGIYHSSGLLQSSENPKGSFLVKGLETSKYLKELNRYIIVDFAPLAVLGKNCISPRNIVYLPVSMGKHNNVLNVSINSGGAMIIETQLEIDGDYITNGACTRDTDKRSTGFDTVCELNIPKDIAAKLINLEIRYKPRTGPIRIDDYKIQF